MSERNDLLSIDARAIEDAVRNAELAYQTWHALQEDVRKKVLAAVDKHTRNVLAPALGMAPLMLESLITSGFDAANVQYLARAMQRKRQWDQAGTRGK